MKVENLRINGIEFRGTYDIYFNIRHKKVKDIKLNYKKINLIGMFNYPNEIREVNLSEYFKIDDLQLFIDNEWDIITITITGEEINKYKFFRPFVPSDYGIKETSYKYNAPIRYID